MCESLSLTKLMQSIVSYHKKKKARRWWVKGVRLFTSPPSDLRLAAYVNDFKVSLLKHSFSMRFIHGILDKQPYYCCFSILFLLRNLVSELVMLRIVIAEGILPCLNKVILSCLKPLTPLLSTFKCISRNQIYNLNSSRGKRDFLPALNLLINLNKTSTKRNKI